MRKILLGIFGGLLAVCANAAQVANLDYVHKLIAQKWDISVPIKADNPMQVANMKYLLTAIDVANEILNGEKITDYGNGEFATLQVADTTATNAAVETLIKKEQKHEFTLTTTSSTSSFSFSISAAGEFVVDWGDGTIETITKPDTTNTTYSHNYTTAGAYTIGFSGQATAYNTEVYTAAISFVDAVDWEFYSTWNIASIDGSLGAIFGTLSSDTNNQPRFYGTFNAASNMNAIPANLFAGISGAPAEWMFAKTFYDCSRLTSIPENLFAGISGAPASYMFEGTFEGCGGLTSIPENLFGNISGTAQDGMFRSTFYFCVSLTGPSARINGQYLYEIWPDATEDQVGGMYGIATKLSDYSSIPSAWK